MSKIIEAYAKFVALSQEVALLSSAASVVSWDMEVMMPKAGAEMRSQVGACLAGIVHEKTTSPQFEELLSELKEGIASGDLNGVEVMNVIRASNNLEKQSKLPIDLVKEYVAVCDGSHHIWQEAKASSDFGHFRPSLERIVALTRERARILDPASPYGALLDEHDPGMTVASVQALLTPLGRSLRSLVERIKGSANKPDPNRVRFHAWQFQQERLCHAVAEAIGFDPDTGRLDPSAHPFSERMHPGDLRITTTYDEADALSAIYSTIHEVGHSFYEGGLPAGQFGLAGGTAASYGMHEANSRMWEILVGRSKPFSKFLTDLLVRNKVCTIPDADTFYRDLNAVNPSFIRTEADEVTYGLHICLRFEIERDLIEGRLEVADVRDAWNGKMKEHLGLEVVDDAMGVLQDVHWAGGMFGYFPSYALGNAYSAQLYAEAVRCIPGLEAGFEKGEFASLRSWLHDHVWKHGFVLNASQILRIATNAEPSSIDLISHLERKYGEIYRL